VYKSLISSQIVANAANLCSTQKRALRAIGVMEHECQKHKIAPTDELIHERCVTLMQRVLNDPNHPVTKELIFTSEPANTQAATTPAAPTPAAITPAATSQLDTDENNNPIAAVTTTTRVTRNQFEFDIALCKTERHMNTFVPKYMREKSGFTTEAAKIRAAEAAKQEKAALKAAEEAAKKAAKPRVACSICAKLCTTGIAITNHVKACEKRKAAAASAANYSSLPDFFKQNGLLDHRVAHGWKALN